MSDNLLDDMANGRIPFQCRVTWEAMEGWEQFCADNGVTLTAFVETIGRWFRDDRFELSSQERELMAEAKALTQQRARRRRRSDTGGDDTER